MSAITIAQGFITFMSGPFGVAIIGIALILAFIYMAFEHHLRHFGWALVGGGGFYSVSWIMANLLQGGGGGGGIG
jgi:hypothetical protein